jgi:hypothetical protein
MNPAQYQNGFSAQKVLHIRHPFRDDFSESVAPSFPTYKQGGARRRIDPDSLCISTLFEQAFIRRFHGPKPLLDGGEHLFRKGPKTIRFVPTKIKIHYYDPAHYQREKSPFKIQPSKQPSEPLKPVQRPFIRNGPRFVKYLI